MLTTALIGLGTMGPGIAATLSRGGIAVRVHDVQPVAMERARGLIDLASGVLDRLGVAVAEGGPAEIMFCDDLASTVQGAGLVIENVPEKIDVKASLYRALDPLIGPEVIVASDTSGIPITKLQAFLSHPERFVGMHWSNPPHIIPMIEVIAGEATAPATVDFIVKTIRGLKLLPVVVKKDVPWLRREPGALRPAARSRRPGRGRRDRPAGHRHLRVLGYRLQARHRRAHGAARYGRARHL